jgi:hypothetical protein
MARALRLTGKSVQVTLDFRGHSLVKFHELPVSPNFAFSDLSEMG